MEDNVQQEQAAEQQVLYAGKFKTIEELENGYKNAAAVYNENVQLKKSFEAPEEYKVPDNQLPADQLQEITALAKNAGINQSQFEKLVTDANKLSADKRTKIAQVKDSLGEMTINMITDYVKGNYPEEIAQEMLDKILVDKKLRDAALSHREKLLVKTLPGLGASGSAFSKKVVTDEELLKASLDFEKDPANMSKRDNYINLLKMSKNG